VISIYYDPKFYLRVDFAQSAGYTCSLNKELGFDINRDCKTDNANGFRIWDLRKTLDKVKQVFPGFESAEFGDGLNTQVTPAHVYFLLKAVFWITADAEVKELVGYAEKEMKSATRS